MVATPFVSKLCVPLMGRFSTKNQTDIFDNKISTRFLYELQNIGLIFWCDSIFVQVANSHPLVAGCLLIGDHKHPLRKGLVSCLYKFCSEESTDVVNCWLVSNLPLRCKNEALISVKCTKVNAKRCVCLLSWFLLYWDISEVGLAPINNWQNLLIPQNKICIGSWPDRFWVGAYNLQPIGICDQRVWYWVYILYQKIDLIFCNSYKNRVNILYQKSIQYFATHTKIDPIFCKNRVYILLPKISSQFFSWKSTHQKYT